MPRPTPSREQIPIYAGHEGGWLKGKLDPRIKDIDGINPDRLAEYQSLGPDEWQEITEIMDDPLSTAKVDWSADFAEANTLFDILRRLAALNPRKPCQNGFSCGRRLIFAKDF
jgi:hypothetical protein